MTKNASFYQKRLLEEKKVVLNELRESGADVGEDGHHRWEAKVADIDTVRSDVSDVADRLETYEENTATTRRLNDRLLQIDAALERIDAGTFGICEVGGKEIEDERLKANPAATTCKKHLK
jgi:RNA polymerase-binding transcription factor DksA